MAFDQLESARSAGNKYYRLKLLFLPDISGLIYGKKQQQIGFS
jgi:hypothetical protein